MINTVTKNNTLWNQEDTRREFADVFDNKLGRIQGKYKTKFRRKLCTSKTL